MTKTELAAVGIVIAFGGMVLSSPLIIGARAHRAHKNDRAPIKQIGPETSIFPQRTYTMATWEHDGHKFVVAQTGTGTAMIHHPGCKCLLTPAPVERP